jgi:hypothetical protein
MLFDNLLSYRKDKRIKKVGQNDPALVSSDDGIGLVPSTR